MTKHAVEKKHNGNDTRPKTVSRLQQLRELISPQLGAASKHALTVNQLRAPQFFFQQQRVLLAARPLFLSRRCAQIHCVSLDA